VAWSITQVARMSGVTARTLRHYHEIGLLRPAYVAANGYRYYEREQLLRLQEILLLRELGMGLGGIGEMLAGSTDRADALRRHRARLLAERDRLTRLAATVTRTIAAIEAAGSDAAPAGVAGGATAAASGVAGGDTAKEGEQMTTDDPGALFDGFDAARYEQEARERWGDEAVDESRRRMSGWTRDDAGAAQAESAEINRRLSALMAAGRPADDPEVLDAVDAHYRWVRRFWTPDRESYPGLGRLYTEDLRFRANYDRVRPGLADYLRDAMAAYASARLS
jgi:DNA-binding transcriptional MerR regulator